MKTKTSLKLAIKQSKFDWVDSDIEKHFSAEDIRGDMKIFHFGKSLSSEEAIREMAKEGYLPANISELLKYAQDDWNGKDWTVALGSSAQVSGYRCVPCLGGCDAERRLHLRWWGGGWPGSWRLLGVRNSQNSDTPVSSSALSHSDSLTLPETLTINGVEYKRI